MAAKWIEALTGSLEQKKQYKQTKARLDALPEPYRATADAFRRYFLYFGGISEGDTLVQMLTDFADLWERASFDGTPLDGLIGDDPVEFAENFASSYSGRQWIDKERARLIAAVTAATAEEKES